MSQVLTVALTKALMYQGECFPQITNLTWVEVINYVLNERYRSHYLAYIPIPVYVIKENDLKSALKTKDKLFTFHYTEF